ncbi:MAG TPA: STAS domain-containing protein [Candidatus Limnocylindrales bacterium]|nr:STAS domain-containing protein [Candidatus Limnocylindrales bacterium]
MLRITRDDRALHSTRLHLEGRLTRLEAEALEQACAECRTIERDLVLDLSGVRFADETGAALLRRLRSQNAVLANPTPFLSELLSEEDV